MPKFLYITNPEIGNKFYITLLTDILTSLFHKNVMSDRNHAKM